MIKELFIWSCGYITGVFVTKLIPLVRKSSKKTKLEALSRFGMFNPKDVSYLNIGDRK